ncbi:MAG TPA: triose-phosphate isomerase [Terricaulis sp.]|nr:triose-phosphate isomerase [Terricaulis sp.]
MAARKPLIAGNWKMHGRRADLAEAAALESAAGEALKRLDVLICPPAPYLEAALAAVAGGAVLVGAQDCSPAAADAARTGEVSAGMLADVGAQYVIVGHSERRSLFGETDETVRQKAEAAQAAGLTPIVCVGETQAQRDAGQAGAVVAAQVRASTPAGADRLVVAYEPVWAIGGSRTPTLAEIAEIHSLVRNELISRYGAGADGVRVLYGGSVNPKNAGEIFAVDGVDGALVGRAALKAADFSAIIKAHPAAL